MCVCPCVSACLCVCLCVCLLCVFCVCRCVSVYLCMCLRMCVCCVCICVHVCVYVYFVSVYFVCVSVCTCVCLCVSVCMSDYIPLERIGQHNQVIIYCFNIQNAGVFSAPHSICGDLIGYNASGVGDLKTTNQIPTAPSVPAL